MVDELLPSLAERRTAVVAEARRWIDVKMVHLGAGQLVKDRSAARQRGVNGPQDEGAVDCFGLILGIARAVPGLFEDPGAELDPYLYYGRLPDSERMKEALDRFLIPLGKEHHEIGDIGFFAWGAYHLPMHLAIMARFEGRATMIHANGQVKPRRVRENTYAADWPNQLHGFYRYPGLLI